MQGGTRWRSGPRWGRWGTLGRRTRVYGQRWWGGDSEAEEAGRGGGECCRRPPRRQQSPRPVPHGRGSGHRHRCPPEESRCCLGGIPRQRHALPGGPRPPFPLPRGRPRTPRACSQGQGESHRPPPSSQLDPKTNALTKPDKPQKLTSQVTAKHKTTPLPNPPLTQPSNRRTPKWGLKK